MLKNIGTILYIAITKYYQKLRTLFQNKFVNEPEKESNTNSVIVQEVANQSENETMSKKSIKTAQSESGTQKKRPKHMKEIANMGKNRTEIVRDLKKLKIDSNIHKNKSNSRRKSKSSKQVISG